jgi:peptidyl-prolyl cis-trans isomerase C
MNRKIFGVLLLVGALGLVGFWGFGSKNNIATVEGQDITLDDLDARLKSFPPQFAAALQQKENKVKVLDQLIDEKVILVFAEKEGYSKKKEFKQQLENAKNQLLLSMVVQDKVDKMAAVSEEEVRRFYQGNPNQFQETEQRRARHILVKTEAEANAIVRTLKAGADFSKLAREKSVDSSATNGGDLGWFTKGQLVPAFEAAVFSMQKGHVSGIVKTQFGFHIIRLEDVMVRPRLDFDKVKGQIKESLLAEKKRQLTNDLLTKLKKQYKIKKDVSKIK